MGPYSYFGLDPQIPFKSMYLFLSVLEWTSPKFLTMMAALLSCAPNIGYMISAGLAFLFRIWHHLQLTMSVPIFFFLILTRYELPFLFCVMEFCDNNEQV
jgi:OCT family organic anion/cation transporter-like MFS transporter 9/10/19/24/25